MKKNEKLRAVYLIVVFLLLVFTNSYGQNEQNGQIRNDKTAAIINNFHFVKHQIRKYEIILKPMIQKAHGNDSIKLLDLKKQITEDEITKRICAAFTEVFNDDEINIIYDFMQTSAYKKLTNSGEIFKAISFKFDDFDKEIKTISDKWDKADQD